MKSNLDIVNYTYNISGLKGFTNNPMKDSQVISAIARNDEDSSFINELKSLPYSDDKYEVRCDVKLIVKLASGNNYELSYTLTEIIRLLSKHYNTEE